MGLNGVDYFLREGRFKRSSSSFFERGSRLIAASRMSAWERVNLFSRWTSRTGRRDRVYAAPLPVLCWITRRLTSVVIPVYNDLSPQRTK